jgi:hypothetical protein
MLHFTLQQYNITLFLYGVFNYALNSSEHITLDERTNGK